MWDVIQIQEGQNDFTPSSIEEITGDLRQWFMTWGLPFTYRVYSGIVEYMTSKPTTLAAKLLAKHPHGTVDGFVIARPKGILQCR